MIGKHRSIIVWSSIKQTTIVRQKKKKIERYSTRFYSGRSFPLYAPAIHTERIQMKFAFQMDSPPLRCTHKVHFPRMYLARLPFELRDGISSIYIYIHTPGIKASLHLWLSFTDRLTDCTGPQYIAKVTRWRSEWNVIYRDLNDITGLEMKVLALAARTCYLSFLREMKVTRQIFLSDGNNRFSIFFFFLSLSRFFSGNNC